MLGPPVRQMVCSEEIWVGRYYCLYKLLLCLCHFPRVHSASVPCKVGNPPDASPKMAQYCIKDALTEGAKAFSIPTLVETFIKISQNCTEKSPFPNTTTIEVARKLTTGSTLFLSSAFGTWTCYPLEIILSRLIDFKLSLVFVYASIGRSLPTNSTTSKQVTAGSPAISKVTIINDGHVAYDRGVSSLHYRCAEKR